MCVGERTNERKGWMEYASTRARIERINWLLQKRSPQPANRRRPRRSRGTPHTLRYCGSVTCKSSSVVHLRLSRHHRHRRTVNREKRTLTLPPPPCRLLSSIGSKTIHQHGRRNHGRVEIDRFRFLGRLFRTRRYIASPEREGPPVSFAFDHSFLPNTPPPFWPFSTSPRFFTRSCSIVARLSGRGEGQNHETAKFPM